MGRFAFKGQEFRRSFHCDEVLELDALRRSLQQQSDSLLAEQKKRADQIGALMKKGLRAEAEEAKAAALELKAKSSELWLKAMPLQRNCRTN